MNPDDKSRVIDRFSDATILVIGDLMLDRYLKGTMSRISPEAPAPLIEIVSETFNLGGAANAISTIRALGGNVIAAGVVGDDWFGKRLIGLLKQEDVDTTCVMELKERPTTVKTRIIAGQSQILRLDRESKTPIDNRHGKTILDFIGSRMEQVDAILISDYQKGVVTNQLIRGSIDLAKRYNKPVILYPKVDPTLDYAGISAIIMDREKASTITGIRQINETSIRNMGHWLQTHLRCESVLITSEISGYSLFEKNDAVIHVPPDGGEIHNLKGLADTFASTVILSLASGVPRIADSIKLASVAAGIVAGKHDAKPVTRDELIRHGVTSSMKQP